MKVKVLEVHTLFRIPKSFQEIADFAAHSSTPADATIVMMLTINFIAQSLKDGTIIGDTNKASELVVEDFIKLILTEEENIAKLKEVKTKSLAIDNLIKQHRNNIRDLVKLLEDKE